VIEFVFSSIGLLFEVDFWEYAIIPFLVFIFFSLLVRFISMKLNFNHKFYLYYPLISLFTIIPMVSIIQFFETIKGLTNNRDSFIVLGIGLNILAYLILNIIIGVIWTILNKTVLRSKGEK